MSLARSALLSPSNVIAISILLVSCIWLSWWFYDRSQYVYVTDARIAATMINISSRIPGWITEFSPEEGQQVARGELLARIDSRDATLQLQEMVASIQTLDAERQRKELEMVLADKQIAAQIASASSSLQAARAGLAEIEVERVRAEKDFARATSLLKQKMISDEVFEDKKATSDKAIEAHHRHQAEVAAARAMLLTAEAELARIDLIAKDIEIAGSRITTMEVERTRLADNLADHEILSPVAGIVDETFINPGEHVYPGQRILMLHDPTRVWIKANIKETEIRHLEVGNPVYVSVDAYPDQRYEGTITNIGSSATSQFAMLPSPNPSGNFTKTTQRLEVRVELIKPGRELKPGMMVELQIPRNQ